MKSFYNSKRLCLRCIHTLNVIDFDYVCDPSLLLIVIFLVKIRKKNNVQRIS